MRWKLADEEKRLWKELGERGFDPERSPALPEEVLRVLRRELWRTALERLLLEVACLGATIYLSTTAAARVVGPYFLCLAFVGNAMVVYCLSLISPSRRWLNAILLIIDLSSDLTPDTVVRCLLHVERMDRFLRYKKHSYSRVTLHKAFEHALLRAKNFVASEEECQFLLAIARQRALYPKELRVAALSAVSPPGITLTNALRRQVEALTDATTYGESVKIAAGEVLRRSWPPDMDN